MKLFKATIIVYLDTGNNFEYEIGDVSEVNLVTRAREHANRIVTQGYQSSHEGKLTYYPVHRVMRVDIESESLKTFCDDKLHI
jgi:hypothetical protein